MSEGTNCVVGGGELNTACRTSMVIGGGLINLTQGQDGFLGGEEKNQIKGQLAALVDFSMSLDRVLFLRTNCTKLY